MTMEIDLSAFSDDELIEPTEDQVDDIIDPAVDPKDPVDPIEPKDPIDPLDDIVDPNDTIDPLDLEEEDDKGTKLVYSNIAKLLKEEGLFDEEIKLDDIESSDKLVDALRGEIKRNEFADLSDTQKEYLEAIREGIPDQLFSQHKKVESNYNSITDAMIAEDETLRRNIILADLTAKGMNDKRAKLLYKSFSESGEDVTEAVESLNSLKTIESERYQLEVDKINNSKIEVQKEETKRLERLKNSVYETKEIIKNYKITEKLRDNVYNTMTKGVAYNEAGQPINKLTNERDKDPVGFDTKLYYLFEMTKGFKDFSIFERKAQSKASRELERVVKESNMLSITGKPNVPDVNQTDIPQIIELSD
jgi:hypothetical protein